MSKFKVAVLIDGGFLRVVAKRAGKVYDPAFIEKFAHACGAADESIFRILYYDCAMYSGTVKLPVSGESHTFTSSDDGSMRFRIRTCLLFGEACSNFEGTSR